MNRSKRKEKVVNPAKSANFISTIFFTYTAKLFLKGFKKELSETDIYEVLPSHESKQLGQKLETQWTQQTKKNRNSILYLLIKCFGKQYLLIVLTVIIPLTLTAVKPQLSKKFILYFASDKSSFTKAQACGYGALLVLAEFIENLYYHNFKFALVAFAIKIRAGLISLIYRRILKLTSSQLDEVSIGNCINLITKDVSEFEESVLVITLMLKDTLNILIVCCVLYSEVGWFCMVIIIMIAATVFISTIFAIFVKKLKIRTLAKTDMRVQTTKEVLNAITLLKFYLWGNHYGNKIQEIRKKEVSILNKIFILLNTKIIISTSIIDASWYIIVVSLIFSGIQSNAGSLFLILSSMNTLRFTLQQIMPRAISEVATIVAVVTRLGKFLRETDTFSATRENDKSLSTNVPLLNLNLTEFAHFEFTAGITAITGPVGSGKSFLLKILAKEHESLEINIKDAKRFSYASQEPWLFPSTIKQNILFGGNYDHERYLKVIKACALLDDLERLKDGDSTVVADRGVNLSGGQQARINLARAVYKDCDVYLFDDCLAHLDVLVADFIFKQCFCKFLKDKIIIVATQNSLHIENSNRVVTLENGAVKSDILSKNKSSQYSLSSKYNQLLGKEVTTDEDLVEDSITETTNLIEAFKVEDNIYREMSAHGKVKLDTYKKYVESCGGLSTILFVLFIIVLIQVLATGINKLEANWINSEQIIFKNSTTMKIYTKALENRQRMVYILPSLIVAVTVLSIFNVIFYSNLAKKASVSIHKFLLSKILNSSAEFFDKHFTSNILNRFSEDLLYLDEFVPRALFELLKHITATAGVIILAATINVYFLIGCLLFAVILTLIRIIYLRTGRALKRLEFSIRSPLVGHLNATLEGLSTIRILKTQNILCDEFDRHQDLYTSSSYMYISSEKAFHFVVGTCAVCLTAFAIILFLILDKEISVGNVGLGLLQILSLSNILTTLYRTSTRLENFMTTVERILQYTTQQQENKDGLFVENWPSVCEIQYENVYFAYSANNYVLSNLSFVIKPKSKLAIVGRTASGKTSLISTLLRLHEIKGKIYIDNVDIATLPLDLLRSNVSIIPQEPNLFSGTLRENIDPTNKFSDDEIWNALKTVHLAASFQSLDDKISYQDTNLSTGQKQLICLCRALVRNNKIVIFDEVTATVDCEIESIIHNIISNNFMDSTVLIITHRFRYILDYDKILVLDKGTVVEFDNPHCLLEDKNSLFSEMYYKQKQ